MARPWRRRTSTSARPDQHYGEGAAGPRHVTYTNTRDRHRLPHATRTHELTPGQKTANRVLANGRAPVEHGFAHLKNWRILTKLRTGPARATCLLRALPVLTNLEVNR
ncbi:transposase family protein [Streptomyces sp. NPDC102473]|uniref:transposase family protein n=1 Tax=Streptomyces sp. NPDC102473 TaxID=3366180 RepID=UPI00382312DF